MPSWSFNWIVFFFFFLYLSVSLREVVVLVPALLGEYHQLSALPHNTPSPTPLSRWACLLYGLLILYYFLTLLPAIFFLRCLLLNLIQSQILCRITVYWHLVIKYSWIYSFWPKFPSFKSLKNDFRVLQHLCFQNLIQSHKLFCSFKFRLAAAFFNDFPRMC